MHDQFNGRGREALIAGATGTGKTKTLQLLSEALACLGER
jgi:Flp pilus assembly CpaF family ATPase